MFNMNRKRGNNLDPVAGEFEVTGTKAGRGQTFTTRGGGVGRYVGTTRFGNEWVAYDEEDFDEMCDLFDKKEAL